MSKYQSISGALRKHTTSLPPLTAWSQFLAGSLTHSGARLLTPLTLPVLPTQMSPHVCDICSYGLWARSVCKVLLWQGVCFVLCVCVIFTDCVCTQQFVPLSSLASCIYSASPSVFLLVCLSPRLSFSLNRCNICTWNIVVTYVCFYVEHIYTNCDKHACMQDSRYCWHVIYRLPRCLRQFVQASCLSQFEIMPMSSVLLKSNLLAQVSMSFVCSTRQQLRR